MSKVYEIRCPIHGFIELDEWEWEIINQPAFQRLRRIRQLGLTDYVYPGAMHTRFEHALGVMHIATRLYDAIVQRSGELLKSEFRYNDDGLRKDRRVVRLAALLHDVGHAPLSHAAEELMPRRDRDTFYRHEDYTAAIIRTALREAIENHPINATNYHIKADEVASLIEGSAELPRRLLFWRDLISSQMDADRMDYLLRDSYHAGVRYGVYDLDRLVNTVCAIAHERESTRQIVIGVSEDGWHAAESLVLARYYMFTQVYFHKTRRIYDYHIVEAMRKALPNGQLPPPDEQGIREFLQWDDWRFLGTIQAGQAGEHGKRIIERRHYRAIYSTAETPTPDEWELFNAIEAKLSAAGIPYYADSAEKQAWYNLEEMEIVVSRAHAAPVLLSTISHPVRNLRGIQQQRLYVPPEQRRQAEEIVAEVKPNG
ncbi:MAG: HD domain-containing protein [Fimbriimonadales bacterium]|nr:HD domain-containing protein [Fimbriimonadales bacterium]